MKIQITKGCVVNKAARPEGDELEVADREGRQLIAMGKAIEVEVSADPEVKEKPKPAAKKARTTK